MSAEDANRMQWWHLEEMGAAENGECCADRAKETFACFVLVDGEVGAAFIKAKTHMDERRGVGCGVQEDGEFHKPHVHIAERKISHNKGQRCVFPFGRSSPGIWDAGELAPFCDSLSILARATSSEDSKARPVKNRCVTIKPC